MLVIAYLLFSISASAQNQKELLGKWESKDKGTHYKYLIFEHHKKLYAVAYYIKEKGKKVQSFEEELNYVNTSSMSTDEFKAIQPLLILDSFVKKGKVWKGKLIYDEKGNSTNAYLKYINKKSIEVGVKSTFYSDSFVWKRIQK